MKNTVIVFIVIAMMLLLPACGSSPETASILSDNSPDAANSEALPEREASGRLDDGFDDSLSVSAQLALGSLQLEESDLAISEGLAAELLPLWQAYMSLSSSDTAAEAELRSLVNQIQEAMSPEQVEEIANMRLTSGKLQTLIEEGELILRSGGRGFQAGGFGGQTDLPEGGSRSGGFIIGGPGGGPGGGAGGFGGGPGGFGGGFGQQTQGEVATRIVEQFESTEGESDFFALFTERALINQIITTLQVKTGEIKEEDLQFRADQATQFNDLLLETISTSTGLSMEEIQAKLGEGSSLAEIIEAGGGDVARVKEELTAALSELPLFENQDVGQMVDNILTRSGFFPGQSGD